MHLHTHLHPHLTDQLVHDRGARLRRELGVGRRRHEVPAGAARATDRHTTRTLRSVLRDPDRVDRPR